MVWTTGSATIFEKIGAWLTTTAVGKAISWTVAIVTVGTGVKGFQEARELMSRGQDILGQKTSQGGKLPIIYGRRRVGSTVVFMNTADKRSKDLFVVYALSVGEVDQIELDTIEINGVSIKDTAVFRQGYYAGSDKISSGAGSLCTASQIGTVQQSNAGTSGTDPTKRYRMVFNAHHGADDQTADPMLTASISSQWTSSHRLRGVAYLACSFEYDNRGMFSSIPQLTVIVRGKKVYDPRLDGSISGGSGSHRIDDPDTYEWSDNAVLCTLDYMTNDEYGKGLGASSLNLQSFQTAADTSDELEDTPDYSGSYAAATFSTTSGQREISVDETTWIQAKASGKLNLRDSGATSVFADCEVVGGYRFEPFGDDLDHRLVLDCSAGSTYTDETGTALVQVKRFHCNGVVDANKNVLENTRELLANMRGILNYIDGKYEIVLEDTASSSFTVTDDHIINSAGVTLNYESKADKANKVVVQFFNEKKKFEMDTVTVFHDATPNYKSDDGGEELELVVDFPYVINSYVAYNMGEAILGRSRNQQTISFTAVPELYKVKVGDVITVAYTPLGLTGKLFRVENIGLEPTGLVNIQAVEYLDIYTWEAPPQEVIEDYTYIPQGFEVSAPTGLTFTDSNTSATGRPFLSWNEPTDFAFHEYRINIVDSSSNKLMNRIVDVNFVDLTFLPVGSNYVASVSSINSVGSESDAATLTFSVGTEPVATADVKDLAVTTGKIGNSAVTTVKINDLAVTNAKINDLNATKITAGTIDTARLNVSDIISTGSIIVSGDNVSSLTNDSAFINGGQVNSNVTSISGGVITTGTVAAARIDVSGVISAGSIIVSGSNVSSLTNDSGYVNTSQAASAAPVQSVAGATGNVSAATIITAGSIVVQGDNVSSLTNDSAFINGSQVNSNVTSISGGVITTGTINANRIQIDNVTLDTDGSGNLIIKTAGVDTTQLATDAVTTVKLVDRATSVFATATGSVGYWYVDNLPQTAIVTTGVFQAPSTTGNTFFIIGNTYINANSGGSTSDWCELQVQRRSASTSGGVSSAAYSTIATIRARGETGEALQSIIANDAYTADYYYQYRVTLQTNGTGQLYSTRSYGISGIQVIVNYK